MNPQAPPPVPKKARGCFFYGCITSLVFLLVLLLGIYLGVRFVIKSVRNMTDTAPISLPKVELSAQEMTNLNVRIKTFSSAVDGHSNTPPLVLTSREVNALLAQSAATNNNSPFYVSLEGDAIKGQVSLPLDPIADAPIISIFHLKGRYLNGAGSMQVGVTNGVLGVYIKSLEVKGRPLPSQFMTSLSQQNLADSYNKDPRNSAPFEKFESITVKDSTMIVTPKKE